MRWLERDSAAVWHPYTAYPIEVLGPRAVFERAAGSYLYDDAGKPYFDATSSWWCNLHGHCHPRLVEALRRQAGRLDQILFSPHTHAPAVELSEALLARLGAPFARVFFSDDGSTAVEAALKMALQYWHNRGEKRRHFLSLERGYHGDTLGAVSVSHVDEFHHYFAALRMPVERVPAPYCYRCPVGLAETNCRTDCLGGIERWLERHGREVAAVILEPMLMGAGGMIFSPERYLSRLVSLCRRYDILVIFDEVFTGFGRTGTFFAMEAIEERPDIVCLSKGLTSGMLPLAVTVTSGEVFEAFSGSPDKSFYHGHTFTANALGVAVALESLRVFDEEHSLEKVGRIGEWMARETPRFAALPCVGEVRHRGGVWAVELVRDKATREVPSPANGPGWSIARKAWGEGIWLRPLHNVLYCVPPYSTTESDLRRFFSVLYSELQEERHFTSTATRGLPDG